MIQNDNFKQPQTKYNLHICCCDYRLNTEKTG